MVAQMAERLAGWMAIQTAAQLATRRAVYLVARWALCSVALSEMLMADQSATPWAESTVVAKDCWSAAWTVDCSGMPSVVLSVLKKVAAMAYWMADYSD